MQASVTLQVMVTAIPARPSWLLCNPTKALGKPRVVIDKLQLHLNK